MNEDLHEVKFRGMQYNLFDDAIEIIKNELNMPLSECKKYLLNAIIKWQEDNKEPIGPVRLMDPPQRETCVASIMDNFQTNVAKEKNKDIPILYTTTHKVLEMFKESYMYQDEWD